MEREKFQLKLGLDRAELARDLGEAKAELDRFSAMEPTAEAKVGIAQATANIVRLEAQLATLDKKRIEIQIDIDNDRLDASANKLMGTFAGLRGKVADFGGDVRDTRSAVEGLGNVMSAASKVVFLAGAASQLGVFVAALLPAVGALLAVPAVALSVASAFAVVKIGTSGMGDAFKAVADGDAKALDEAMKKLSPSAQQVVKQYQSMKPAMDGLKLDVQEALFKDLSSTMAELGQTFMPVLQEQFVAIASQLNQMAFLSAQALMAPETVSALNTVLAGTSSL